MKNINHIFTNTSTLAYDFNSAVYRSTLRTVIENLRDLPH